MSTSDIPKKEPIKKLIALDLDGTLLTSDKRITDRTKQALKAASNAGYEPVIITGRPLTGLPPELEEIPEVCYAITSNGAVTTNLRTGQALRFCLIPPETAAQITQIPDERSYVYSVFMEGIGYCTKYAFEKLLLHFSGTPLEAYVRKSRRCTAHMRDQIFRSDGVENIWIVCDTADQASALSSQIRNRWSLQTFRTAPKDVEMGAPGADKGAALACLYRELSLRREDTIAIGDNHNDLSMLQAAGTAIAMGNATEEIRVIADRITETNDHDGVAIILESLCVIP